jgi:hypothetical protein
MERINLEEMSYDSERQIFHVEFHHELLLTYLRT